MIEKVNIKNLLLATDTLKDVKICGWIRTFRNSKNISFIHINDGSTIKNLQIVFNTDSIEENIVKYLSSGACIEVVGNLNKSQGKGQNVEIIARDVKIVGKSEDYPIQPKKHTLEFLRSLSHLRLRTNTYSAVFRIKSNISYAIHNFFKENGFFYIHTPIITSIDAEGAGEMFNVTTLDLKTKNSNFSHDFFGKKVNLTVSGQLAGETAALALGKIYTFGPTFRAENSNTSRHLSEFWMVEPEMAFYSLKEDIELAETFLKYIIKYLLKNSQEDLYFLNQRYISLQKQKPSKDRDNSSLIDKLNFHLKENYIKITYDHAFEILKKSPRNKKKKFKFLVDKWGLDFQSEHEKYLTEIIFKKPVVITNFPKDIKAFYMYLNDDKKTVKAMDVLVPGIGEIIGGSQREHRLEYLLKRIEDMDIDPSHLSWYLDTRRFGTAPHSGFGLGLERLVQYITGIENIRDVILYPRTPGKAEC